MKEGFSFPGKDIYEAIILMRWLDKLGHPTQHTLILYELAAKIKILSKKDPLPLNLLLCSSLNQQELSRMNLNSLSLLYKAVQVTPELMRMLGGLLEKR